MVNGKNTRIRGSVEILCTIASAEGMYERMLVEIIRKMTQHQLRGYEPNVTHKGEYINGWCKVLTVDGH